jgi:hypothetical protein
MHPQQERRKEMPYIDPEVQKQAVKEALHEFLEARYAAFGRFSLVTLFAAAFCGLMYLFLGSHGWKP